MAEQTNEWMTATPSASTEGFEILEAGAYDAVCVGLTRKNFKKYQSDELESKFQFIFQVVEGDTKHYLRTLPLRNVINEKSNLFLLLSSWTGVTLEKAAGGIDLGKLVGFKAQVVVGETERDGKKYNTIENVLKAKKNSKVEFVEDDSAPAYLTRDLLGAHWIDGLSFAEAKSAPSTGASFTDDDLIKFANEREIAESGEQPLPF